MKIIKAGRKNRVISGQDGYGIVETLIVIILTSVLILIVMGRYEDVIWEAKKTALKTELGNIRQAITFFRITKGKYPDSLYELAVSKVIFPHADPKEDIFRDTYLSHYTVDDSRNIIDPFGLPFEYNSKSGEVRSRKKGFEKW